MFWDSVAGVYDVFVNIINRKTHKALKEIVAAEIEAGDSVLECGCGTGMLSLVIAGKCKELTATDFSLKMLMKAAKKCGVCGNVYFSFADITELNYPDNYFDKVVAGNVIHLLDQLIKALEELNRVCKPGGVLIIPTYVNKNHKEGKNVLKVAVAKAGVDFKRSFTTENYKRFFLDAGYEDVEIVMAEGRISCAVATMTKIGKWHNL